VVPGNSERDIKHYVYPETAFRRGARTSLHVTQSLRGFRNKHALAAQFTIRDRLKCPGDQLREISLCYSGQHACRDQSHFGFSASKACVLSGSSVDPESESLYLYYLRATLNAPIRPGQGVEKPRRVFPEGVMNDFRHIRSLFHSSCLLSMNQIRFRDPLLVGWTRVSHHALVIKNGVETLKLKTELRRWDEEDQKTPDYKNEGAGRPSSPSYFQR